MDHSPEQYRSYVLRLGGMLAALLTVVFTINALIDPLWHFRGNRLGDVNYRFEERRMKLNLFMNDPDQYDCLIFGASRATLLDEGLIGNSNCFNMAFSLGHVREYVLISEYLAERGYNPDRVIVAIDEISFQPRAYTEGEKLPDFIVKRERASLPVQDYLGVTTLRFSLETLFDPPGFIRAYQRRDDGFRGILLPTSRTYDPQQQEFVTEEHFQPYDERMVGEFLKLRAVFPDAEFEGYIPPLSDWSQARIDLTGNLERYIDMRYDLAPMFDGGYWDFSVPSETTADTSLTFDGEHYEDSVNAQVARCLGGEIDACGADVLAMTRDEYRVLILPKIRERIETEGLTVLLGKGKQGRWAEEG